MSSDKTHPITFTFEGQSISGYAEDTVASALYRWGLRIFSRGLKFHRARGIDSLDSASYNTIMQINGVPNERASTTLIEEGMVVARQHVEHDYQAQMESAVLQHFSGSMPAGIHYKTSPYHSVRQAFENIQKEAGGMSSLDADPEAWFAASPPYFDKAYQHTDVTIIGGGVAGLSAAVAAAEQGAQVVLVEEEPALGGGLRYRRGGLDEYAFLAAQVQNHPKIDVLLSTTMFGVYEDNLVALVQGNRLIKLRTDQLIVAAGNLEQPLIFHNNDLPGVMLSRAALRLMHLYDVKPGERAVVMTSTDDGWQVADDLLAYGVDVIGLVDARARAPIGSLTAAVAQSGTAIYQGYVVQEAVETSDGSSTVAGAIIALLDDNEHPIANSQVTLPCDLIVVAVGALATNSLLDMNGCPNRYDASLDDFVTTEFSTGTWGAGAASGTQSLKASALEGEITGRKAALAAHPITAPELLENINFRLKKQTAELAALKQQERETLALRPLTSVPPATVPAIASMAFVDMAADATEQQVLEAIAEGFDDIQILKRYSTISQGLDQGKSSSLNLMRILARETGKPLAETGRVTTRPPFVPVKLGVLAGRMMEPERLSPLHECHQGLDAKFILAGGWQRAEHYGEPIREVTAVRERVGMIDVSTLGKIDVRGPEVPELLNRLYTNGFGKLGVGRVRYGIMCNEEGVIIDDGVVARLSDDRYYISTTSGGSGRIYEWMQWWNTVWGYQVHLFNVTSTYAALNVAGPQARATLSKLTDLELGNEAFPYMQIRSTTLAGIPVKMMRIGFVGEVGFEIHVPADQAVSLWDAIMEAGADFGIAPFGVEAQRVLRLEKGHIIVGQDTDALADPFGSQMAWIAKMDKPDFIGKPSLQRRQAWGQPDLLTGFVMDDAAVLPSEGEQIVEDGKFIGRITSARYSPTLNQSIGLCWIQQEKAVNGTPITVWVQGKAQSAKIMNGAFYDPEGTRLKG